MPVSGSRTDSGIVRGFQAFCGDAAWQRRLDDLARRSRAGRLQDRATQARHALEIALGRLSDTEAQAKASPAERRILALAGEALRLAKSLPATPRRRLRDRLAAALTGDGTLVPVFHLVHLATRYRDQGFAVAFTGLEESGGPDLVIRRDGAEAEIACETVSAEEGRSVHRGDWYALVDRINPELQRWLASHPGRYLLKMTLPEGLAGADHAADLQDRIMAMLRAESRQRADQGAVLKLDPLMLAGAQAADAPGGLQARLRAQFGPEAHLALTGSADTGSVFVMAARAGRENAVAQAVVRRLSETRRRLTGGRPGILAAFVEDLDRREWRALRDTLELEGAVRRYLTTPEARDVAAVSCASRMELFGMAPPDAAAEGELRFRNPSCPGGKHPALAPAIASAP